MHWLLLAKFLMFYQSRPTNSEACTITLYRAFIWRWKYCHIYCDLKIRVRVHSRSFEMLLCKAWVRFPICIP